MKCHSIILAISLLIVISSLSLQVFGQEVPGLVRCSAGNLVRSYTECPSTDRCPPQEHNIVVHCSRIQEPQPVSAQDINETQTQALSISTDKKSYNFGEVVNITVKNTGTDPLTFPNSALGLNIENSVTHEKYPIFAAQVISILDSGGTKSLSWDQKDSSVMQVKEGNYTASTSTGSLNANTTFTIVS